VRYDGILRKKGEDKVRDDALCGGVDSVFDGCLRWLSSMVSMIESLMFSQMVSLVAFLNVSYFSLFCVFRTMNKGRGDILFHKIRF